MYNEYDDKYDEYDEYEDDDYYDEFDREDTDYYNPSTYDDGMCDGESRYRDDCEDCDNCIFYRYR